MYIKKYQLMLDIQEKLRDIKNIPVILCIGSNRVAGDCLGPLVGEMLVEKYKTQSFVYGTMREPINANNIQETSKFISVLHGNTPILTIDAAVGHFDSIGKIKVYDDGIYPGLATGKVIDKVGTHSIIGIVEENSYLNATLLNSTKLQFVYEMATIIAEAINDFIIMKTSQLVLQ